MLLSLLTSVPAFAEETTAFPSCGGLGEPRAVRTLRVDGLDEASGLALGQRDGEVLWTHNDHGSKARLYALSLQGEALGKLALPGIEARDWEDIAAGTLDEKPLLFVADTGNNDLDHREVAVLRLEEPAADGSVDSVDVLPLRWPDTVHDAEGLGFDPVGQQLVLATKERKQVNFYVAPAASRPNETVELALIGTLELLGFRKKEEITALDLTPDGSALYLRSQDHVLRFTRTSPTEPLASLLARPPCNAPSPDEPDAEALAATPGGYLTVSEGDEPTLFEVRSQQ